jgi:hypothetical protein
MKQKEVYEMTLLCVCVSLSSSTPLLGNGSVNTFPRNEHIRKNRKNGGCGVFYVVRVVANSQYVVKGKWMISSSQNYFLHEIKLGKYKLTHHITLPSNQSYVFAALRTLYEHDFLKLLRIKCTKGKVVPVLNELSTIP